MSKALSLTTAILVLIAIPAVIYAITGGQGKVQGNSCMAQCMGINAEFFDASNEVTQFCQAECGVGTGQGACLTSADGCCVPFTDDPDCLAYPECQTNENCLAGEFCDFPAGQCGTNLLGTCEVIIIFCSAIFNPLCGCDGITYSSECARRAAQVQLDHSGECEVGFLPPL